LKDLTRDVGRRVDEHEIAKLIMTIEGVGPLTAACLIAELGDPARFDSPGAIASYVGVIPRIRQSGKKRFTRGPAIPLGNARLRKALWMVVLQLIRRNPWLRQYYERLPRRRQTRQGRSHRGDAKVTRGCVERRYSPQTLRAYLPESEGCESCLTDTTVSSGKPFIHGLTQRRRCGSTARPANSLEDRGQRCRR
jgi:hypothetical protein